MIIVSYYTINTPYEQVMNTYLRPSLERWKLNFDISGIKDLGSWQENTSFKAEFCLNMLNKYEKDICFIDSDATIEQLPVLLYTIPDTFNIACHLLDWFMMWRNKEGHDKRELLSGTMVLKYNIKTLDLMKKYVEACTRNTDWEQKILQQILEEDKSYKLYQLPQQYCAIKRRNGLVPEYMEPAVIVHHQVSRQYKRREKKYE